MSTPDTRTALDWLVRNARNEKVQQLGATHVAYKTLVALQAEMERLQQIEATLPPRVCRELHDMLERHRADTPDASTHARLAPFAAWLAHRATEQWTR